MKISKVFIASDHGGFEAKEFAKTCLEKLNLKVVDLGTNSDESVDYPDFANALASNLKEEKDAFGILVCGTGIGISIAANRHAHVRCALCHDVTGARLAREHNDANVLAFGGRVTGKLIVEQMIEAFFATDFAGGRHERRVAKLGGEK